MTVEVRPGSRLLAALGLAGLAAGLHGCVAIPAGAALGGAFSAGAGAAVHAGKEYTRGGVVYRTFTMPLPALRDVLGDALERMEIAIIRDEPDGDQRVLLAAARDREVKLRLEPVTRTVTQLRLVVGKGTFGKDRATATEIMEQTERLVEARLETAVTKAARGNGASSPARADRRSRSARAAP
ncbi:MAG TPA: hypothetical protein VEA38_14725 [Terriglobales bacterium]|nr:hypothetical protein [Terriglobales bacterium]